MTTLTVSTGGFTFTTPWIGVGLSKETSFKLISSYDVICDFCKKRFEYYDFGGDFGIVCSMLRFTDNVIGWLKRFDIPLEKLAELIVGITEPRFKVYETFVKRLKRRLKKAHFKFIEIVFKIKRNEKEYRGVLAGRMSQQPPLTIDIENAYWVVSPPFEGDDYG